LEHSRVIHAMKVLFNIVAVLLVWQITSPARPRTCLAKAKDSKFVAKAKDLIDLQGQGQGLKICPRGQLKAKDQGQGQQHWCMTSTDIIISCCSHLIYE